jgi:hypothetical protein
MFLQADRDQEFFWRSLHRTVLSQKFSLVKSNVIPGKLAVASATRNDPPFVSPLAKGDLVGVLDPGFRRYDERVREFFKKLLRPDLSPI